MVAPGEVPLHSENGDRRKRDLREPERYVYSRT